MSTVIVTAADEGYAPLLRDLLNSLAAHKAALDFRIAVLDLGLAPSTRRELETQVDRVISPSWMFKPHAKFAADPKYLSRAARPFLPDLVPGHSIYIWLDADTWLQQRQGLEWLIGRGPRRRHRGRTGIASCLRLPRSRHCLAAQALRHGIRRWPCGRAYPAALFQRRRHVDPRGLSSLESLRRSLSVGSRALAGRLSVRSSNPSTPRSCWIAWR